MNDKREERPAGVVVLRAVNRMSPRALNDIMARHYPLAKPGRDGNVGRYLNATGRYGTRVAAVEEILVASSSGGGGGVRDETDTVLPARNDCAEIAEATSSPSLRDSDYLDELECNTTRNCLAELEPFDESSVAEYEVLPIDGDDTPSIACIGDAETETVPEPNELRDDDASAARPLKFEAVEEREPCAVISDD